MSVLVTGGAGFLGGFIVEGIQEQHPDWTVASLDIHNAESPRPNVHYIIGSVTNHGQVQAAVRETKPSLIIHTAGQVPPLHSRYNRKMQKLVWKTNVDGTQIMLEVARAEGVKAFVWTSSVCCVTDDLTKQFPNVDESWPTCNKSLVYGESKVSSFSLLGCTSPSCNSPFRAKNSLGDLRTFSF
jgi:sterol-4alpha-carboxylate 3-dehydrogenase (decarboxylating)